MLFAELLNAIPVFPSPFPFPIEDVGSKWDFGWAELSSIMSAFASLVLLGVTAATLAQNRKMAESALESAAASASQVVVKFTAKAEWRNLRPLYDGLEEDPVVVAEDERLTESVLSYKGPTVSIEYHELSASLARVRSQRKAAREEHEKTYYATPSEAEINVWIGVEGAMVEVHRVALVEYPWSRHTVHSPPTAASRTPNIFPDFYWGYRLPLSGDGPVILLPGDSYLFESGHEFMVAPGMLRAYLQHNRFVVEYSFPGSKVRRLARANFETPFTNEGREIPTFGGALSYLPSRLTTDFSPRQVREAEERAQVNPFDRKGGSVWVPSPEGVEANRLKNAFSEGYAKLRSLFKR